MLGVFVFADAILGALVVLVESSQMSCKVGRLSWKHPVMDDDRGRRGKGTV